jgi:hypothetical protein
MYACWSKGKRWCGVCGLARFRASGAKPEQAKWKYTSIVLQAW